VSGCTERDIHTESKREKSHAYPVSQLYMEVRQAGLSPWLLPEILPTELVCGNHEEHGE
jgi:hypothetical protein